MADNTPMLAGVSLEILRAIANEWRARGAVIDTHHATMGTGYKVCARELEEILEIMSRDAVSV